MSEPYGTSPIVDLVPVIEDWAATFEPIEASSRRWRARRRDLLAGASVRTIYLMLRTNEVCKEDIR